VPVSLKYRLEFRTWSAMKQRCQKPTHKAFPRYGGRGIKVCERWQTFANFYADMGPRPSKQHSLDRINNDGHYEPSNCRWATRIEQNNNRRDNVRVTISGKTQTLTQWGREAGTDVMRVFRRIKKGWPIEKALTAPVKPAMGMKIASAKLTDEQVVAIKADRKAGLSLPAIGRKYGVAHGTIWQIVRGYRWKHIP
jgi:hypothetical protein